MKELASRCGRILKSGNTCVRPVGHGPKCQGAYTGTAIREVGREWARQRNAWWHAFLVEYKTTRGCARCPFQSDRGGYFDMDHVDRTAPWAGKGIIYHARRLDPNNPEHVQRVLNELEKCQVLCVACHREKTGVDLAGDW